MSFSNNLSTKDITYIIKQKIIEFSKIKTWRETLQKEFKTLETNNIRDLPEEEFHVLFAKIERLRKENLELFYIESRSNFNGIENLNKSSFNLGHFRLLHKLRKDILDFEKNYLIRREKDYVEPIVEKVERSLEVRLEQLESTVEAIESGQDILRDEVDELQEDVNELKEPSE